MFNTDKAIDKLRDIRESVNLTLSIDYDHINSKIYGAQIELLDAIIVALQEGNEK